MSFQSLGFLVFLAAGVWVCRLLEGFRLRRSSASAGSAAENALPLTLFSLFFYWQGCGGLPDLLPIGADLL